MQSLVVVVGSLVLFGAAMLLLGRTGERGGTPGPQRLAGKPEPPAGAAGAAGAGGGCVRCGRDDERLVPTPEGMMCEACYSDAK